MIRASHSRAVRPLLEALELAAGPFSQMEVDPAQTVEQRRFVEVTVVVEPPTDVGIDPPGGSSRVVSVRFWTALPTFPTYRL